MRRHLADIAITNPMSNYALQCLCRQPHAVGVAKTLVLWLLVDGKRGHENQSLGLAEAIIRRVPAKIHRIDLSLKAGLISRILSANAESRSLPAPDFILAAGHATHAPLLWLSKSHGACGIVLMRPSLPSALFDCIIVPEHDYPNLPKAGNILLTKGALNRVTPVNGTREGKLILIGGPSKIHGWNEAELIDMLAKITDRGGWELTDSRRTPKGFAERARAHLPGVVIHSYQESDREWLPGRIRRAEEIWVTEDSVSMIYESLSGGARVGLLPIPRLKQSARVLRGIDGLISDGYLTSYETWLNTQHLTVAPNLLSEADRCAGELIQRGMTLG
jgi:mitochondrial fission protein ELM1